MAEPVALPELDSLKIPPGQHWAVSITITPFDGGGHRKQIHRAYPVTWDGQRWDTEPEYLLLEWEQRDLWRR
jgi:hypothetical protein